MRGYFEFLLGFPNTTFEDVKNDLKIAKAGTANYLNITQMDYIEKFILSTTKKIFFNSETSDWTITPGKEVPRGTLFWGFIDIIAPELLYDDTHAQKVQEALCAKIGELDEFSIP